MKWITETSEQFDLAVKALERTLSVLPPGLVNASPEMMEIVARQQAKLSELMRRYESGITEYKSEIFELQRRHKKIAALRNNILRNHTA